MEDQMQYFVRETHTWQNTIMHAQKQVVLFFSKNAAGTDCAPHPLVELVRDIQRKSERNLSATKTDFGKSKQECVALRCIELSQLESAALPKARRSWNIGPLTRDVHVGSPKSLEMLLSCRFAWALHYGANIRRGALLSLSDGETLVGKLAHSVFENLFGNGGIPCPTVCKKRAFELFDSVGRATALPLFAHKYSAQIGSWRMLVAGAAEAFAQLLHAADLSIKGSELRQESFLDGQPFVGRLDFLCSTQSDMPVVLDLKWSQNASHRRREMIEGKAVQLAAYSWLLSQQSETMASVGYYMLRQRELYFSSRGIFPNEAFVNCDMHDVWKRTYNGQRHRLEQIRTGRLVADGVEVHESDIEDFNNDLLRLEPPCKLCIYKSLCGKAELI